MVLSWHSWQTVPLLIVNCFGDFFSPQARHLPFQLSCLFLTIILYFVFYHLFISLRSSKEGKKYQKTKRELKALRKRKTELEKKLDNLELLERSKKHNRKKRQNRDD
jgi:membrane protein insertase Oxa1/YidC/SpoIIIJ